MASHLADGLAVLPAYIWHSGVLFHGEAFTSSEQWRRVTNGICTIFVLGEDIFLINFIDWG